MGRRLVALFLLLFGLYYSSTRFCLDGYELEYVLSAMNIYQGNGPAMAPGFNTCPGIHDTDGDTPVFPRQNYLQSYLSVPYYALGVFLLGEEPTIPGRGMFWEIPWGPLVFVSMLNPMLAALTAVLVGLLAGCFGLKPKNQLRLIAMFGLTTMLWHYAGLGMEIVQTTVLTLCVFTVVKYRQTNRIFWLVTSVLMIIALPNCKKHSLIFVLPIVVYFIWSIVQNNRKRGVWIAAGVLAFSVVGSGIMMWTVMNRFHHDPELFPHLIRTFTAGGFSSLDLIFGLLISPGEGLLIFNPMLFYAIPAWVTFSRRFKAEMLLFSGLVGVLLCVLWRVPHVLIDEEWGPRYLLVVLPLMFVAGAKGFSVNRTGKMKLLFILILIVSIFFNWVSSYVLGFKVLDAAMVMGVSDYFILVFTPSMSQIWLSVKCFISQLNFQLTGRHHEISYKQYLNYTGLGGNYITHHQSLEYFDYLSGGIFVIRWVLSEAGDHRITPRIALVIHLITDWLFLLMIGFTVFYRKKQDRTKLEL